MTVRLNAMELFCRSGGMAEGFRRAGVRFAMAVDADPDACDSYEANLGHRPIQMDARDLLRMLDAGWMPPRLDLLVADPPCTPWSRAGKRKGLDDERDMLRETAELIVRIRPRAYLIGNVPGLDDADHWRKVVQPVIGGLKEHGYCVADYASLDAADYGVPQHRIRPFWFGHLDGPCIRWPAPTHGDWSTMRLDGREPWVTCREALIHLPKAEIGRKVRLRKRKCNGKQHGSTADKPARVVGTSNLSDGNVLLVERQRSDGSSREHLLDEPARTVRASRSSSERLLTPHKKHPINSPDKPAYTITARDTGGAQGGGSIEWPWDRPSTTITQRAAIPPPGHHPESGSILSLPEAVVLSERAAALLQAFPQSWEFAGKTKRSRWSQIGQAMPPPLSEAVARSIVEWFARTEVI